MELAAARQEGFIGRYTPETKGNHTRKRLMAVIGITTGFGQKNNRDAIRKTWLPTGRALASFSVDYRGFYMVKLSWDLILFSLKTETLSSMRNWEQLKLISLFFYFYVHMYDASFLVLQIKWLVLCFKWKYSSFFILSFYIYLRQIIYELTICWHQTIVFMVLLGYCQHIINNELFYNIMYRN